MNWKKHPSTWLQKTAIERFGLVWMDGLEAPEEHTEGEKGAPREACAVSSQVCRSWRPWHLYLQFHNTPRPGDSEPRWLQMTHVGGSGWRHWVLSAPKIQIQNLYMVDDPRIIRETWSWCGTWHPFPVTSWQWIPDLWTGPKHGGALLLAVCPEHPHPAAWLTGRLLGHASWDLWDRDWGKNPFLF